MRREERGDYIDLLAASWNSGEPGTLPFPVEMAARCAGLDTRLVRHFFLKYPHIWVLDETQLPPKYVNKKLHDNWLNYKEISEKRRIAANIRHNANASQKDMQNTHSASAPASAPAFSTHTAENPHVRKVFQKPTLKQIFDEMVHRGIPESVATPECEAFLDHHETRGWKLKGQPMVSWKAAVGTWKHNLGLFSGGNGNGQKSKSEINQDSTVRSLTGFVSRHS
jgi:hypothetical protein